MQPTRVPPVAPSDPRIRDPDTADSVVRVRSRRIRRTFASHREVFD